MQVVGDQPLHAHVTAERWAAGEALVQNAGQRVYVHARVGLHGGADRFRSHVGRGADGFTGLGQRRVSGRMGDAEVDQIGEVVGAQYLAASSRFCASQSARAACATLMNPGAFS